MDRWRDAESEFKLAIQRERLPFLREFMSGIMLMDLYLSLIHISEPTRL